MMETLSFPDFPDSADLPPLIEIDAQTKDIVLGAIKLVLKRLKNKGLMPEDTEYRDLTGRPLLMHEFITVFKANRNFASDLLLNKEGKKAESDAEMLICGFSLAQVERLLVYTCSKKVYGIATLKKEKEEKKSFLGFLRRSARRNSLLDDILGNATLPDPLKAFLVYHWQLPLLRDYEEYLLPAHFKEAGKGIFCLKTEKQIKEFSKIQPDSIKHVRSLIGGRFLPMMKANPAALRGLARCDEKKFIFFSGILGDKIWEFFARDPDAVVEFMGMDRRRVEVFGSSVASICADALRMLNPIPTVVLSVVMETFHEVFGDLSPKLLGSDEFSRKFLYDVTGNFRNMTTESESQIEEVTSTAQYKWNAIKPKVDEWLKTQ